MPAIIDQTGRQFNVDEADGANRRHRIATHVLAFEDEGQVVWSEGSYADYEADRKKRFGAEADRPHRLRYTRLK
jgi:hypothetical protein